MGEYAARAAAHDLDGMLALIADDAVYWFSNESTHVGKLAVAEAIRINFETITDETYELDDLRWIATSDDVAVCTYAFKWTGTIGGHQVGGAGRGTNVLRRDGEQWLVVHEHLSKGAHT